jgi:hypothetical protein
MVQDEMGARMWSAHGRMFSRHVHKGLGQLRRATRTPDGSREVAGVLSALLLSGLTLGIALGPCVPTLA